MYKLFIFLGFTILFFSVSCKRENDPSLLLISPTYPEINLKGNQGLTFSIKCSSNSPLKSLLIQSKIDFEPAQTILDSTLSTNTFQMDFDYIPTNPTETVNSKLSFILTDENHNQTTIQKLIHISPNEEYLKEKTGIELWSSASGKFYTLNLKNLEPLYKPFTDSSLMHIQDYQTDTLHIAVLSKKWHSPAGLKFVRFNDYDYVNATLQNAKAAYDAGLKKPVIDNISSNDIIITKLNNTPIDSGYVVIKLIYVIDTDSVFNDKYIFDVKK
jgi:hypothetical protein